MELSHFTQQVKDEALRLGFSAVGFAEVQLADTEMTYLYEWLRADHHAGMAYMANNLSLRRNPQDLVEGARTVISLALNYYPAKLQHPEAPHIAYYAYGKDYHKVLKKRLQVLWQYILSLYPSEAEPPQARCFTDSAPILERYWAWKAGLGFIGKNTNLILPGKGSYFFLGEIITTLPFLYDTPQASRCGTCTRCIDACPSKALRGAQQLDARRCLSYLTIEHRGEIASADAEHLGNRLYGCDTCQMVCPWNNNSQPTTEPAFAASEALLQLSDDDLMDFTPEKYEHFFAHSAARRAKYEGMYRNAMAYLKNRRSRL